MARIIFFTGVHFFCAPLYYPIGILWCIWDAVVECELKKFLTSEILWVTLSQIQFSKNQIRFSLDRIFLGLFWQGITEFEMILLLSSVWSINIHFRKYTKYLYKCCQDSHKYSQVNLVLGIKILSIFMQILGRFL